MKSTISVLSCFVFVALTACASAQPSQNSAWATSTICEMPNEELIVPGTPGWAWLGITVNVSTYQDLLTKLGEPQTTFAWPQTNAEPSACVYHYSSPGYPNFWLVEGKVVGIQLGVLRELNLAEIPKTIADAKGLFGHPELVGWSSQYSAQYRSVIWISQGVQAEVGIASERDRSLIGSILYFPRLNELEFSKSMWTKLISYTEPPPSGDVFDGSLPQNPFDW